MEVCQVLEPTFWGSLTSYFSIYAVFSYYQLQRIEKYHKKLSYRRAREAEAEGRQAAVPGRAQLATQVSNTFLPFFFHYFLSESLVYESCILQRRESPDALHCLPETRFVVLQQLTFFELTNYFETVKCRCSKQNRIQFSPGDDQPLLPLLRGRRSSSRENRVRTRTTSSRYTIFSIFLIPLFFCLSRYRTEIRHKFPFQDIHKILRDEEEVATAANSYETRLAKNTTISSSTVRFFIHFSFCILFVEERLRKDYLLLLAEYCICDLSRYKKNQIGVRWRIDAEVFISIVLVAYSFRLSSVVPSMLEKVFNKFKTHVEPFSTSRSSPSIA